MFGRMRIKFFGCSVCRKFIEDVYSAILENKRMRIPLYESYKIARLAAARNIPGVVTTLQELSHDIEEELERGELKKIVI